MVSVPDRIRPGTSSTVNIISETIKNDVSIPIHSLTSRPENYDEIKNVSELYQNKGDDNDDKSVDFKKAKPIDVVFILQDEFNGEKAADGQKYAIVKPIKPGISGENYYSIQSGVIENDIIVTGGYRLISKQLNHGDLVSMKSYLGDEAEDLEKEIKK